MMKLFPIFNSSRTKKLAALALAVALTAANFTLPVRELPRVFAADGSLSEGQTAEQSDDPVGEHTELRIVSQPVNVTVSSGQRVTLSVSAEGEGLQYQWYYRKYGSESWSIWNGHTTPETSAISNATWNLMKVYCSITDAEGNSVNSNAAVIRIDQPLVILAQPKNMAANVGDTVTFALSARGTGKLSYQWYYKKQTMTEWQLWKGHTTASTSAITNSTWNLMQVYCRVTDEKGSAQNSQSASITIRQPLRVLSQPKDTTVKAGDIAAFTVSAQGTGKLTYQWYFRKYGVEDWTIWNRHTTASTSAISNATWNMMQVYCMITDETGATVRTRAAVVKIDQPLSMTQQPKDTTVKGGQTAVFSVSVRGFGKYSYQWYRRMPGESTWSACQGMTSEKFTVKAEESMNGMLVYCRASDESGTNLNSNTAKLTVVPAITITGQPAYVTVHSGETATFTVKATGSGLKYQWYYKKAGKSAWTLWNGKTSATVSGTANCTWHAMQVYCRITDSAGQTANSKTAVTMITKKSSKRYITRTFTVKTTSAKIYDGPGTSNKYLGTLKKGAKYTAVDWDNDASDVTWFKFNWNGKAAWISRKNTTISDTLSAIPDRSFKDGGLPVIYISPSRQTHNEYAAGSTTEGVQMYRVGNALKKILEEEYYCVVYMPPVEMKITLNARPTDAYNKEADVYLAIHSNANSSGKSYGAVGYYFPTCAQSNKLGENMANEMGKISPFPPTVKSKTVNGMTAFDNLGYGEVRDPAYFGMISLLAEVEYHDNADSAKWIINNTDKIARALANALEKTIGMQKK